MDTPTPDRPATPPAGPAAHRPAPGARWTDLDRPPLDERALRRALVRPGALWSDLTVVARTGSTNTDLLARAAGAAVGEGAVLVAEEQSSARGRLDRRWSAPPRSGLFFSVCLTPGVPIERWGWLPLLAGVATATALSRVAGVDTALKWPNDLLVTVAGEERKAGGILAERVVPRPGVADPGGVVLGIGLNVSLSAGELPVPQAGSLALAGARTTDRDPLLRAVLRSLEHWYGLWREAGGDPGACGLQETYAAGCSTLGRPVRALLPGDRELRGVAEAVDGDGRLVLRTEDGERRPVDAGDIVHLRPQEGTITG
ncbi:biotin--[acetyl-CoA-carboxylase] ligase [Streptomyces sp. NPDC059740]|uniref:biotin--[acetyl-CoA-carboxylase] ligase n=1 Tax=Streptomyces sp. NPDC059740 TaxID=3346926 RepID=UPI003666F838